MIIENTLPTNHDKKPQTKNKQKIATDSKLENPNRELKDFHSRKAHYQDKFSIQN